MTSAHVARACIALLLLAVPAAADEELITDRPDQTESSANVPPDRVQIESGLTFVRDDRADGRIDTSYIGSTLVRIGLDRRFELRLGWFGFVKSDSDTGEAEDEGPADTALGTKLAIVGERGRRPETALIVAARLPTGKDGVSTERVDPTFRFTCGHTLSERVDLGYNFGPAWETTTDAGGQRHTLSRLTYTTAVGFDLPRKMGMFVEAFGDFGGSEGGAPAHSFDGGFTWLVRNNVQLDASGGFGLSDAADDWFAGLGVSARLPH